MPFNPSAFVNTGQFSDYSSMSGLSNTDQMKSLKQVAAEAMMMPQAGGPTPDQVAPSGSSPPPTTFGGAISQQFDKAIAPITNTANKIQGAFNQASQGNIYNAVTGQNPTTPVQPTAPALQTAGDQHDPTW